MISWMVTMTVPEFEELVRDALDGIPADLGAAMENVAVVVDDDSPPGRLLGLYQGVPLTAARAAITRRPCPIGSPSTWPRSVGRAGPDRKSSTWCERP